MRNTIATIAVIDDDESIRHSLRQLLRAADFDALTFGSAEEYLDAGDAGRADCLIVDVNLPGMSGVALVRVLTEARNTTPVILITARDDRTTAELIQAVGGVPHLRKPFGDRDLFATLRRLLPDRLPAADW